MPSPSTRPFVRRLVTLAIAGVLGAALAKAVTISPVLVVLDERRRTAEVALFNNSASAEEVELTVKYGVWEADSTGHATVDTVDSLPGAPRNGWVRVYPTRVVLEPGARQVVRIVARPPAGLAGDQEYPFRLLVTTQPATVAAPRRPDGVETRLNMRITQSVPVFFRNGSPTVQLGLERATFSAGRDSMVLDLQLAHRGTAAWVGTATLAFVDSAGAALGEVKYPLTVQRSERRRLVFPGIAGDAGVSTVRLRLRTVRDDLAGNELLLTPPIDTVLRSSAP